MSRLDATLRMMRPPPLPAQPPRLPLRTGLRRLDLLLGGGLPRGQLLALHGPPGVGKSQLALRLCAAAQRVGSVAYLDADCAVSLPHAVEAGVSLPALLYAAPALTELADIAQALAATADLSLVVVDAAEGWPGPLRALRQIRRQAARSGVTFLFLTQHGPRPGVCWGHGAGIPHHADPLAFTCHSRLQASYGARGPGGHELRLGRVGAAPELVLWLDYTDGLLRPG